MPPPGGAGGVEFGGWLDEPLTEFEVGKVIICVRIANMYLSL